MTQVLGLCVLALVATGLLMFIPREPLRLPRFRGVRIVLRGVRVARPAVHAGNQVRHLDSAPHRSTNGHRLQLAASNNHRITTTTTTKGAIHG